MALRFNRTTSHGGGSTRCHTFFLESTQIFLEILSTFLLLSNKISDTYTRRLSVSSLKCINFKSSHRAKIERSRANKDLNKKVYLTEIILIEDK